LASRGDRAAGVDAGEWSDIRLWQTGLLLVAVLTLLRLAFLHITPLEFDMEEAQYWVWGETPAWGYFSKPPLIAWLDGASAWLCGPSEACARTPSPLLHAATALILGATGLALGSRRLGAWAMLIYATLPGVAFSAMLITTDVPLLFFWALGLYAFVRLRQEGGIGWAGLAGVAGGLGALSKYAMLFFPVGIALYLALSAQGRRSIGWSRIALMAAILLLLLLPNIFWNAGHGGITIAQTARSADMGGPGFRLGKILAFLGGQLALFGPVLLYLFLHHAISRPRKRRNGEGQAGALGPDDRLLLLCLSVPFLVIFLLLALLSKANANWAAFAYIAATILVADLVWGSASRWIKGSIFAHGIIGLGIYAVIFAVPLWPSAPLILVKAVDRLYGWRALGQAVANQLAREPAHTRLLTQERALTSLLLYYGRVPPGGYAVWNPDRATDSQYELVASLEPADAGPFLMVGYSAREPLILARFTKAERVSTIIIPLLQQGAERRLYVYRLSGFRGYQP
jgi:4-amino-4-deoxy-L-arabinose transferase-like glycosyltransferase